MLARLTAIACALVLLIGVGAAGFDAGQRQAGPTRVLQSDGQQTTFTDAVVIDEIIRRLRSEAVEVPPREELYQGGIDGVLEALGDDYAAYYTPEEFDAFNEMLDGEFSGVGLELQQRRNAVVVVRVLEDTPAQRAGVVEGERIVSVDGQDVTDKPIDVIVSLIKGEPGTTVRLGLSGPRGDRVLSIERETISLPSLEARLLDDGNGLIELTQFTSGVGDEVRQTAKMLVAEGAAGIVLDLRGNPGGLLPEAIDVSSVFIEDGPVVAVEERDAEREVYDARGDAFETIPLVVLVDRFSASASEIVAGAIQDSDRGTVVGQPTFGKGTVQTIQRLDVGGGLKFTTAEYFTPSGDSIEDKGVQPDRRAVDRAATEADEALAAARTALSDLLAAR